MKNSWDYGKAFERYPIATGTAVFADGSMLKTHDIFKPLPDFMKSANLVFVDPPWNKGNLRSFYTKADIYDIPFDTFEKFYVVLFFQIEQIKPETCYVEIGKEHLADFICKMRHIYKYVTFYNSSYYHKRENMCYIVRGSNRAAKPKLDYMDEEDIIEWICANEDYDCIGDLCMGKGLIAINAYKNKKRFVGTELNHKRLSVAIEKLVNLGATYTREDL
jgi:hypothetical protein